MKDRPILFNGEMVRAILDGRKTQTRRVVKPQPTCMLKINDGEIYYGKPPYGQTKRQGARCDSMDGKQGDMQSTAYRKSSWNVSEFDLRDMPFRTGMKLWVRETFQEWAQGVEFRADDEDGSGPWTPSIHMPQWASRITLEITDVRVERLQNISEKDACAEGAEMGEHLDVPDSIAPCYLFTEGFRRLWNSLYAKRGFGWDANPFVWAITFRRVENV